MAIRILVTGAAGFIGSNLVDQILLDTDWEIDGLDNFSTGSQSNINHLSGEPRFSFLRRDIHEITSLKPYKYVFHLAALPRIQPSFDAPKEHALANLVGSIHLMEVMIRENHYPRFIYSSSSAVYGNPPKVPTSEDAPIMCLNPYSFQKYEVERYLELLSTRYPFDFVSLRYFNPYGPRSFNPKNYYNAYSSVVGIFLNRRREGLPLLVTGDGLRQRDFIHVQDVARANICSALYSGQLNVPINIGSGATLRIIDLAQQISDRIEFVPERNGEAQVTFADVTRATTLLTWAPSISINEYLNNPDDV